MLQEKELNAVSGWAMVGVLIAGALGAVMLVVRGFTVEAPAWVGAGVLVALVDAACWWGLTVVATNTS
jgi:hypothetical protein